MKMLKMVVLFVITVACSGNVLAADVTQPAKSSVTVTDAAKLDAKLANALTLAQAGAKDLTNAEKEKLLSDLKHPDGAAIGEGVATFGSQVGKGLGDAVRELGTTFNEFASSGVGKIATFILVWHFFGQSILWFTFICIVLCGIGKTLKRILGKYDDKGKFVGYDMNVWRNLSSDSAAGIMVIISFMLAACFMGAAVNF